ncbi:MAG: class I SAM-dependent methyltransferase [Chloroflexota bacterium]|nr:class I SAM-dependent methyltransferase [Chloroflexota bacterium]
MPDEPQTWHYGLVARWWAEFNVAKPEELAYYRACIERYGQPALDLGCGTGRILLPLLETGLDVDGCDVSPDMLAFCHARATRDGLKVRLYAQASHELDLPRAYGTIYICDSFGIAGNAEALRRCHRYLVPGGALVFNTSVPYKDAGNWRYWLPEERRKLPEAWPATGARRTASNGDEIELRSRLVDFDPIAQRATTQMRAILWRDGTVVAQEEYTLHQTIYFRKELLALLARAGFEDVEVTGRFGEAVKSDDVDIAFVCRK